MYTREELIKELLTPDVVDDPVREELEKQLRLHRNAEHYARECAKFELTRCNRLFTEGRWAEVKEIVQEPNFLENRFKNQYHVAPDHVDLAVLLTQKAVLMAIDGHLKRESDNIEHSYRRRTPSVRTIPLQTISLANVKRAQA